MTAIASFVFNPFQENTYIVYDKNSECIIFDPGCSTPAEQNELVQFIEQNKLNPVHLINTHCHIDHVMGNHFIAEKYKLPLTIHKEEQKVLQFAPESGKMFGVVMVPSPKAEKFLEEGDSIEFGDTKLEVLFTPGHSPGSISFYCKESKFILSGDVLFYQSIGRTDLPGGNMQVLLQSINEKLLSLADDVTVYSGHGPETTIGRERQSNPFLVNQSDSYLW